MRAIEWLAVIGLALSWGVSFFLVEIALISFAPFTLVFFRVFIAAMLMLWLIRRRHPWHIIRARWRLYALMGFFNSAVPFFCFSWGQQYIESGLASVINALTPLFVLLLAIIIGREQYNMMRAIGLILGFSGVVFLMKPDVTASEWGGIIAAAVAAICYAIATHIGWNRATRYPVAENAYGQLLFASLFLLPLAFYEQPWQFVFHPSAVAAIMALAVFSTFCAYLLYYFLLSRTGGVNTMLSVLLVPVVAIVLGVVFLQERFDSEFFAGGAMILTGIILSDGKLRQRLWGVLVRPVKP